MFGINVGSAMVLISLWGFGHLADGRAGVAVGGAIFGVGLFLLGYAAARS